VSIKDEAVMSSGDPKAAAEFQEILRIWAEVAQSL